MTEQDLNKKVIIVEGDQVFRERLEKAFVARGCEVHAFASWSALNEASTASLIDWAIVDLRLGTESGLLVIEQLKLNYPTIKILMLTGYGSITTAIEAVKLGASNYLTKPATIDQILAALQQEDSATSTVSAVQKVSQPLPSLEQVEWEHIQRVLKDHAGNVTLAAKALNIHRRSLQRKLAKAPVKLQ